MPQRNPRWTSLLVSSLCAGSTWSCVDVEVLMPTPAPGDLVLWAAGQTKLEKLGVLSGGGTNAAQGVPVDAVLWVLEKSHLRRADGGPVDAAWLESVDLVPAGDEGGCGRCTGSVHGDPLLIFPGDRCRLPALAERRRGEAAQADALAAQFEIAWPGECGCQRAEAFADTAPVPRLWRLSDPSLTPAEVLAAEPGGGVAGVSNLGLWVRAPNGVTRQIELRPSCDAEVPVGTFDGSLRSAALNDDLELVVVEQPAVSSPRNRARVVTLGEDLNQREVLELGWNVTLADFPDALGGAVLLLAGFESRDDGDQARILTCDLTRAQPGAAPTLECQEIPVPESVRPARGIRAAAEHDGHILFLFETPFGDRGAEIIRLIAALPGTPWTFKNVLGPAVTSPGQLGFQDNLNFGGSVLTRDGRIGLCAGANFSPVPVAPRNLAFLYEAELPPRLTESTITPNWTLRRRLLHECDSIIPGPERSMRTISIEAEQPYLAGSNAVMPEAEPPGLEGLPLALFYESQSDRSYVQSRDGALWVWDGVASSTEAYQRLSSEPTSDEEFCPLARGSELIALGSKGTVVTIESPKTQMLERHTRSNLVGLSTCAYDEARDRYLIAGESGSEAFARWLDPDTFEAEEVRLPTSATRARFLRAAVASWGSAFLLGADDLVLEISGADAEALDINWDDPETSTVEAAPDRSCCQFPTPNGPVDIPYNGIERPVSQLTDLDARGGAVWLSSRGGGFLRGFPGRLERMAYGGAYLDAPAMRADCGDTAIVGQIGLGNLNERGDLRGVERRRDGTFTTWALLDAPGPSGHGSGTPVQFFGDGRRLFSIFGRSTSGQGSLQVLGQEERRRVQGPLLRGAATTEGHVLVAGAGGQLYLGADCR